MLRPLRRFGRLPFFLTFNKFSTHDGFIFDENHAMPVSASVSPVSLQKGHQVVRICSPNGVRFTKDVSQTLRSPSTAHLSAYRAYCSLFARPHGQAHWKSKKDGCATQKYELLKPLC